MTIEQKAKAYDEALERANKQRADYQKELDKTDKNSQLAGLLRAGISAIDMAFPQLAESEDERIRMALIKLMTVAGENYVMSATGFEKERLLAYLENQKDANKAIEAVDRIDKYIDEHLANAHDMKDSNPDKKYYRGWDDALGKMAGILQDVYSGEKQKESLRDFIDNFPYSDEQKELPFVKDVMLGYPGIYFYDGERMHFRGSPAMEEKQKEPKEIPLMNGDADLYFDTWIQHNDTTKRGCFEEGIRYAQRLQKEQESTEVDESTKRLNENWMKQHFDEQEPVEKEITLSGFEKVLDTFLFDFANSPIKDCEPKEFIKKHSAEILKAAYKELNAQLKQDFFEAQQEGRREGYEVAKAEQKPADDKAFEEWIDDWWKHNKVNNPDSYDKGDEIQFDERGFKNFCRGIRNMYQQKPAEWSEEDERILKGIIGKIDHDQTYGVSKAEMLSFLEGLRSSWKPSEDQMDALKELIDDANRAGWVTPGATDLYEQLKKLM